MSTRRSAVCELGQTAQTTAATPSSRPKSTGGAATPAWCCIRWKGMVKVGTEWGARASSGADTRSTLGSRSTRSTSTWPEVIPQ